MHVLWISDSPDTPSGFGNVTRFVCDGLARRGHKVNILGWQTREAFDWHGCKVFATGKDPMGGDALYAYLVRYRPEAVIALGDVWWLPYFTAPQVRRQMELTQTPWLLYFPIDGDDGQTGLPPSWIEMLREVDVPIAMSEYGKRIAESCGVRAEYIPHGVDLDTFAPPADRAAAKRRIGADGKFVVLSDSRNQPRKMIPRLLDAYARFAQRCPDSILHLHTDPDDEFSHSAQYSYAVRADIAHLGLDARVRFSPGFKMEARQGLALRELAAYYQAADVHLLASSGEGFGLPTLQAAAAGAVPMGGAYSATAELVSGHGEAIAIDGWSENEFGIRRALIDVEDAATKLERYYRDSQLLRERSEASRRFALTYGWERVIDQWDRLLSRVAETRRRGGMSLSTPTRPQPRTIERSIDHIPGASITVKMLTRDAGRLEQSIMTDARGRRSDVRIPVLPRAWEAAGTRVPRRPGYAAVAPDGQPAFDRLKQIFPVLTRWSPADFRDDLTEEEAARFELAQTILVLDPADQFDKDFLLDAAVFGALRIGPADSALQGILWPALGASAIHEVVALGRAVLTDASFARRCAEAARAAVCKTFACSEAAVAQRLREDYKLRRAMPALAAR